MFDYFSDLFSSLEFFECAKVLKKTSELLKYAKQLKLINLR